MTADAPDEPGIRLFIAHFPEPVSLPEGYARAVPDARVIPAENQHITVLFMGSVPEGRAGQIGEAMIREAERRDPFDLTFEYYAIREEPHDKSTWSKSALWARFAPHPELADIRSSLAEAIGCGEGLDREMVPHITLSRFSSEDNRRVRMLMRRPDLEIGTVRFDHLALVKSELLPKGSEYEKLCTASLG